MNTKKLIALVLASTNLLACAGSVGTSDDSNSEHALDANDRMRGESPVLAFGATSGDVGQGYDSLERAIKPMSCIQGNWKEVGTTSSNVQMTLQADRTQVAQSLGLDVEASYGIYSAAASFMRETKSDDLSVSYFFGGTTSFKDLEVGASYDVSRQAAGISSPIEWNQVCGDSYVQHLTRGSSLYASMKLRFGSKQEKESFDAKIKVAGLISASAALKLAKETTSQNVTLQVSAVQVGGTPTELSRVLAGASGAQCSVGNIDACLGYMTSIEKYASDNFPSQFKNPDGSQKTGTALDAVIGTTSYQTAKWSTLVIPNVPGLRSQTAQQGKLLDLFSKQNAQESRIDAINGIAPMPSRGSVMAEKQRSILAGDTFLVRQNKDKLADAAKACFPTETGACASAVTTGAAGQVVLNAEDLQPWFDGFFPSGQPLTNAADLMDLRNDGHKDLCSEQFTTSPGLTVSCQMGVGGGFEEKASYTATGFDSRMTRHTAMTALTVKTDAGDTGALCRVMNSNDPMLLCLTSTPGKFQGVMQMTKGVGGAIDARWIGPGSVPTGLDADTVYHDTYNKLTARWGQDVWPAGK